MNRRPLRFFPKELFTAWHFLMIIAYVLSAVSDAKADISSKFPLAAEALSKAVESETTVDYVGKRIVILWSPFPAREGKTPSFRTVEAFEERVIHQAPSTHLIELLTPVNMEPPLNMEPRRDRMRRILPPPPPRKLQDIWEMDAQLLLRNYTVDVEAGEPIAGQKTYLLLINPKFDARPSKKVWLDAQHYIILRVENYDIAEKLSSLYVYTTIDYDSASVAQQLKRYREKKKSEKEREPNRPRPYQSEELNFAEAEKQFGAPLPQPSYLPMGFQLQSISVITFRDNPSIHFRYTDGLTVFSLFVSRVSEKREDRQNQRIQEYRFRDRRSREKRFRRGKPQSITVKNTPISFIDQGHIRILHWEMNKEEEQKNLRFVLISELSREELVKIVESLVSQG
ncbi:MAG: sigma-E factor regulatory protein RseB domain-containing protein [Candidatus Poribacteria bacterium]